MRIEIAFDGGHVVSALVPVDGASALEEALGEPAKETLTLDADDGRYTVALKRVLYVKRFAREPRVGFGAS